MKYKFAEEMKHALLVGRAGRHDVVRIDGKERTAWHPAVGIVDKTGEGIPCLVAENKAMGEMWYTVAAVQCSGGKAWICVQPVLLERAAAYFLETGWRGDITGEHSHAARMPEEGKCRVDFDNGRICIEVKISMPLSGRTGSRTENGISSAADYLLKHSREMQESGKRMVCLLVMQHGLHQQPLSVSGRKTKDRLKKAAESGVEFWAAETGMEADGISLLSYHNMTRCILQSKDM